MRDSWLISIVVISTLVWPLACSPRDAEPSVADLRAQRHDLRTEFSAFNNQIRGLQHQALDSPSVQAAQEKFRVALRDRMISLDGRAAEWFQEAEKLGGQLRTAPTDTTLSYEDKQQIASNLQRLEQTMDPVRERAMQDPHVDSLFHQLQDSLQAVMVRIDPTAQGTLNNMRNLERDIALLDEKIARRSGVPPREAITGEPEGGGGASGDGQAQDGDLTSPGPEVSDSTTGPGGSAATSAETAHTKQGAPAN